MAGKCLPRLLQAPVPKKNAIKEGSKSNFSSHTCSSHTCSSHSHLVRQSVRENVPGTPVSSHLICWGPVTGSRVTADVQGRLVRSDDPTLRA